VSGGLTVLVAPDSFKGSLTSVEVARAFAAGWTRVRPQDEILLAPLADGGEGTLVAIEAAGGWEWRESIVADPDYRPVTAKWLTSDDAGSAVIELATASGLSLVPIQERMTTLHTTMGTGELLKAAIDAGVRNITLGIGGSATTDGGAGILTVLGAVFRGEDGEPVVELPTPPVGANLGGIATVDLSGLDPRLSQVNLRIACDVTNPLLGPTGAAATYGPQKGATPSDVEFLDLNLTDYADALEAATGRRERETPGAGAAGGTGFGLLSIADHFASLALVPGIDVVMAAADFDGKLARADVVITGEGRIDEQTAFGKTALGVARRAAAAGVPCIAVGGGVTPEGIEALRPLGVVVVPVVERPVTVEEAMAAGSGPVERCGERIARLVDLGRLIAPSSGS
jgi:glycerate kinase